jgi:hypothetical protein
MITLNKCIKKYYFCSQLRSIALPIALSLTTYSSLSNAVNSEINAIRLGHHPDKIRFVFDLNQTTTYNIFSLDQPQRLVIDFSDTRLLPKTKLSQQDLKNTSVKKIRSGIHNNDDLRIVFDLDHGIKTKSFKLSNPSRLVIDVFHNPSHKTGQQQVNNPVTTNAIVKVPTITKVDRSNQNLSVIPAATVSLSQKNPFKGNDDNNNDRPSAISVSNKSDFSDEPLEFHLLEYQVKQYLMDDALPAYSRGEELWLDFEAFIQASEFLIEKQGDGSWTGLFFNQANNFNLSADGSNVTIKGKKHNIDTKKLLIYHQNELLIEAQTLQKWFDLVLKVDIRQQSLKVTSNNIFPIEQRDKRLSRQIIKVEKPQSPVVIKDHYQWLTSPQVYVQTEANHLETNGATSDSNRISLTSNMDFLKHQMFYSGSFSDNSSAKSSTIQRLTFSRHADSEESWLGFGANNYSLGDVFSTANNLSSRGGSGEGIVLVRQKNLQTLSQGSTTIVGDSPPGWDVELYRNGQLLEFSQTTSDGRYTFEDQATSPGKNIFTIRLYGPNGQYQEQQQLIWGGGLELDPGDYNYRFSHIDFDQSLLNGELDGVASASALSSSSVEFTYGLSQNLQAGVGYFESETGVRDQLGEFNAEQYFVTNIRANLFTGVLLGEYSQQQDQGSAWQARYLGNLGEHSYEVSYQSFDEDFESPYTVRSTRIESRAELSIFGRTENVVFDAYSLRFRREQHPNEVLRDEIFNRVSRRLGNAFISNEMSYTHNNIGDDTYRGTLKLSGRYQRYGLSGEFDYDPQDANPASVARGTLRWQMKPDVYTSFQLSKQLKNNHEFRIDNTVSWRKDAFDLSFKSSVGSNNFWSVGLGVSMSIGYDRYRKSLYSQSKSLSNSGRVAFNVFVDDNKNNTLDSGERVLDKVRYKDFNTDENSNNFLSIIDIPSLNAYKIDTQKVILDNPYLVAPNRYYTIYTHAGSDLTFNIPVQNTGDIEGHLLNYQNSGEPNDSVVSAGVEIELHNKKGELVAKTVSEFDGYYSFNTVPVGQYSIVTRSRGEFYQQHERFFILDVDNNFQEVKEIIRH